MIAAGPPASPASVGDHYDELDPLYRELWGEHVHHGLWATGRETPGQAVEALVDRAARAMALSPADRVCDVGCGYGAPARRLAREHGVRVTGYTLSAAQWSAADRAARGTDGLRFVHGDWLENDLAGASFDAVLALESASHVGPKDRLLREARRVLRPGGRVVICAWTAAENPRPWQVRHLLAPICEEGSLAGLATRREYVGWAREAGLEVRTREDLAPAVRRTWDVCLRRAAARLLPGRGGWSYLLNPRGRHRRFALALPRIWLAYRTGCLGYLLLAARRPR